MYAPVQEVLLLVLAQIGANGSEFEVGKLSFADLFCCFYRNTSFFPGDLLLVSE